MFTYICQAPPCFQFTKKLNNRNSGKVYLVVRGCLQVDFGRLLVVCSCLWSFAGGLRSFVVVACFSNYAYMHVKENINPLNNQKSLKAR